MQVFGLGSSTSSPSSTSASGPQAYWKAFQNKTGLFRNPEDPVELRETSLSDELSEMTSLTMTQRFGAFFMSFGMGLVFIIISISLLPTIAVFASKFAFFFTVGNIFCVGSTMFLVGFKKQLSSMFESNRLYAASVYFGCLLLTLVSAVHWQSSVLAMASCSAQLVALVWYALSYIPYARHVISTFAGYIWMVLGPVLGAVFSGISKLCQLVCSRR
jgi:hypothetical protein